MTCRHNVSAVVFLTTSPRAELPMGWLLTISLFLPLADSDVQMQMWFSRERYCNFAHEKFLENPMLHSISGGQTAVAQVRRAECRPLRPDEAKLIPEHMR